MSDNTIVLPEIPTPEREAAQDPDRDGDRRCLDCNVPLESGMEHSLGCITRADEWITKPEPAPPTTRTVPVWRYFIAYEAVTGSGRQMGNQVLNVPAPIGSQKAVMQIEALIAAHAKFATHGIVGNRPRVTLIAVDLLGQFAMTETIIAEGEAVEDDPNADQPEES